MRCDGTYFKTLTNSIATISYFSLPRTIYWGYVQHMFLTATIVIVHLFIHSSLFISSITDLCIHSPSTFSHIHAFPYLPSAYKSNYTVIHSPTYLLAHSPGHIAFQQLIQSSIKPATHSVLYSFTHIPTYSSINLLIHILSNTFTIDLYFCSPLSIHLSPIHPSTCPSK